MTPERMEHLTNIGKLSKIVNSLSLLHFDTVKIGPVTQAGAAQALLLVTNVSRLHLHLKATHYLLLRTHSSYSYISFSLNDFFHFTYVSGSPLHGADHARE